MAKRRSMKRKCMKTMKKRRMSKMRNLKKNIRKSRKMRGGVFMGDYLPSFLKSGQQKEQKIFDMRKELNTDFENQPVEEEINRIEERNDNITTFSPEYEEEMKKNMKKFNELKQGKQ
jgi:hypothetical protein